MPRGLQLAALSFLLVVAGVARGQTANYSAGYSSAPSYPAYTDPAATPQTYGGGYATPYPSGGYPSAGSGYGQVPGGYASNPSYPPASATGAYSNYGQTGPYSPYGSAPESSYGTSSAVGSGYASYPAQIASRPGPGAAAYESLPPPISSGAPLTLGEETGAASSVAETLIDDIDSPVAPPTWYEMDYWFPPTIWEGTIELGMNGSAGNTESFSMKAGGKAKRKTEFSITEVDINYVKTNTNSSLTQHNAIGNAKIEWPFAESPFSIFARHYFEYDEFKAYDVRLALNAGIAYKWFETDVTKFSTRVGAGWSREIGGPDDRFVPEGLLGADFSRQISKRQKLSITSDYFPDWGDFSEYRIVTDASWQLLLDDDHNLNLKVGVIDRYDSTPNGQKPNDINYSITLLWEL